MGGGGGAGFGAGFVNGLFGPFVLGPPFVGGPGGGAGAAALPAEEPRVDRRRAVTQYVDDHAKELPAKQRDKLIAKVDERVSEVTADILEKIRKNDAATDAKHFARACTVSIDFTVREEVLDLFKDIFRHEYEVMLDFPPTRSYQRTDLLLGEMQKTPGMTTRYDLKCTWFTDNLKISGAKSKKEAEATYTPKAHLEREWDMVQKGTGTDYVVREKGSDKTSSVHKAKLIMHSQQCAAKFCGEFIEAQNPKDEKAPKKEPMDELVLDGKFCTLETFGYVREFLYLGAFVDPAKITAALLIRIYRAASYFVMEGLREYCVHILSHIVTQSKVTDAKVTDAKITPAKITPEELAAFFELAIEQDHASLITFCFAHFSANELMRAILVSATKSTNWERLYALSKDFPKARSLLETLTATKAELAQFQPKSEPKSEPNPNPKLAPASASASASASSSASAAGASAAEPLE